MCWYLLGSMSHQYLHNSGEENTVNDIEQNVTIYDSMVPVCLLLPNCVFTNINGVCPFFHHSIIFLLFLEDSTVNVFHHNFMFL